MQLYLAPQHALYFLVGFLFLSTEAGISEEWSSLADVAVATIPSLQTTALSLYQIWNAKAQSRVQILFQLLMHLLQYASRRKIMRHIEKENCNCFFGRCQ